jgi:predicted enzyme related to lactoylglutathione lyase
MLDRARAKGPMIKRLARLDVAASDLAAAARAYRDNFGFEVRRDPGSDTATVIVGGAEIRLAGGASARGSIETGGEGMFALWLEADDLDQVAAALKNAGHQAGAIKVEGDRRILALDPRVANQVPLFIFDRKV